MTNTYFILVPKDKFYDFRKNYRFRHVTEKNNKTIVAKKSLILIFLLKIRELKSWKWNRIHSYGINPLTNTVFTTIENFVVYGGPKCDLKQEFLEIAPETPIGGLK